MIRSMVAGFVVALAGAAVSGSAAVVSYWNYNVGVATGTTAVFPLAATAPYSGLTTTTFDPTDCRHFTPAGSSAHNGLNALNSDPDGNDLGLSVGTALRNNGKLLIFQVSSLNITDLVLTYAERTSGSGFQQVQAQYSLTGLAGSFTPLAAAENTTRDSVWRVRTFDFSAVNAIEGQSTVYLAVAMLNGTNTGGNIRIDNVQINGTSIPAPASAALVGVAGVFAARRRRA